MRQTPADLRRKYDRYDHGVDRIERVIRRVQNPTLEQAQAISPWFQPVVPDGHNYYEGCDLILFTSSRLCGMEHPSCEPAIIRRFSGKLGRFVELPDGPYYVITDWQAWGGQRRDEPYRAICNVWDDYLETFAPGDQPTFWYSLARVPV